MTATGTDDERHARRDVPSRRDTVHPRPASHWRQRAATAVLGALSLVAVLLGTLTVPGADALPQPAPAAHTLPPPAPSAASGGLPEPDDQPDAVPGHAATAVPGQAAPQQQPREQHASAGQTGGALPGLRTTTPVLPGGNTAPDTARRPHTLGGAALPDVRGPPTTAGA
ncbi:hypothetical protein QNO07_16525 [Streptomyces sp. 549]|uniref:hypothetical protein n=1 Tax=Streptomyces sp. 549 TaxID=3049076 RepID=UPI0024C2F529|nr:hypothetical protein [Streptomyces sp. 549]MDK1475003.1 hypothetical protein [Streptomyces sp. 549]